MEYHWHTLDNGVRIPNQLAYTSPASNLKKQTPLLSYPPLSQVQITEISRGKKPHT